MQAQQLIVQRSQQFATAGVALAAAAAEKLAVDAAGLVRLGRDDVQAAECGHAGL